MNYIDFAKISSNVLNGSLSLAFKDYKRFYGAMIDKAAEDTAFVGMTRFRRIK